MSLIVPGLAFVSQVKSKIAFQLSSFCHVGSQIVAAINTKNQVFSSTSSWTDSDPPYMLFLSLTVKSTVKIIQIQSQEGTDFIVVKIAEGPNGERFWGMIHPPRTVYGTMLVYLLRKKPTFGRQQGHLIE